MLSIIPLARIQATLRVGKSTRAALIGGVNRGLPVSETLLRMRQTGLNIRTQTAYDISNIELTRKKLSATALKSFQPFTPGGSQASPVFDQFAKNKYKITGRFKLKLGDTELPWSTTYEYNNPNLTADDLREGIKDAAQELVDNLNIPFDKGEGYSFDVGDIQIYNHLESLTYTGSASGGI